MTEDNTNDSPLDDVEILKPEQQVPATAIEAIERGQFDIQISTAKRFPRTLSKVKADMLSFATLDEETAQSCFYALPRAGKVIEGPSIRMAEIAISSYGNIRVGSRVLEVVADGDNPHVIVQAVAHDLEKNTAITVEKRRRVTGKKSKGGIPDEDDINLACNSCSAIAIRDAAFKIIPQALIKPVWQKAKAVALGKATSVEAKRQKVMDRLKAMGIAEDRVLAVCGVPKVEDIDVEKMEMLVGLGTAIKDGEITIEAAFPRVASIKTGAIGVARPPNEEVADIVVKECKSNWDAFFILAVGQGWLPDSSEASGFADLPKDAAEKAILNKAVLVKNLKQSK